MHFRMHAVELKPGIGMIEVHGRLECVVIMTVGAGLRQGLLMIIGMTCKACGIQPEVCAFFLFYGKTGNVLRFVAIGTGSQRVGSLEAKAGQVMIKTLRIEPDDLEIHAVVVVVTGDAGFTFDFR